MEMKSPESDKSENVTIPEKIRCSWCGIDPLYVRYHDQEWGVPVHDDRQHFEFLVLETMQAGLSWLTVLRKRENFRRAFDGFDPGTVAQYDDDKVAELLSDAGIIRNRLKILSAINNARRFLIVQKEFGSFDRYIWSFVDYQPIVNHWKQLNEIPARTFLSDQISKDLIKRGFKFTGSTVIYAHMQAIGMIDDHLVSCFRRTEEKL
jgi:DNA-3-methyladenine glycosylase I